ncbi:hypothetical protein ACFV0L_04935 [Streptosporangium canum]|uniref:hypothetical protein n=1 Tax=Streptosporangium canum TaxID=324952 RepID=UPI00368C0DB9
MRLPWAVLYIALDVAKPYTPDANVRWFPGEDIERSYARLHEGVRDELPFVFVSFASEDGGRAHPAGHSSLQVMTVCPPGHGWWGMPGGPADGVRYRRDPAYLAAKRGLTEAMLTAAEKAVGPLLPEVHAGATLGDPSLLPARPAGWDPPAVSRGRGRRGARGRPRLPETG